MIAPIRNTAAVWIALGALMASFDHAIQREAEVGDKVWLPPASRRARFSKGTIIGLPADDEYGLYHIDRSDAPGALQTYRCGRDGFFAVENRPSLDSARFAEKMAASARRFGIQCSSDQCLTLENAIEIVGSRDQMRSAAAGIELDGVTLADLMMLEESGFSMCRHLGGRRARPDDKALLAVIDGPDGINVLEDESFKRADTPAIAILTPDEWISGQSDPDRIANAMEDWRGHLCEQWPEELEMPGLGCQLYRKDPSR